MDSNKASRYFRHRHCVAIAIMWCYVRYVRLWASSQGLDVGAMTTIAIAPDFVWKHRIRLAILYRGIGGTPGIGVRKSRDIQSPGDSDVADDLEQISC